MSGELQELLGPPPSPNPWYNDCKKRSAWENTKLVVLGVTLVPASARRDARRTDVRSVVGGRVEPSDAVATTRRRIFLKFDPAAYAVLTRCASSSSF